MLGIVGDFERHDLVVRDLAFRPLVRGTFDDDRDGVTLTGIAASTALPRISAAVTLIVVVRHLSSPLASVSCRAGETGHGPAPRCPSRAIARRASESEP